MRERTQAEIHNMNWLRSVLEDDSEYTERFKYYAQRDLKKLESLQ
jgi:hypothetical protein